MRILILFFISIFLGYSDPARAGSEPIGYIGFQDNELWAIQFNDCTVFDFEEAEKYLWFDRTLTSISCYEFEPDDETPLRAKISIYESVTADTAIQSIDRFIEFNVSESGWGTFPMVYAVADGDWYQLKEGWVQLSDIDQTFVRYYPGSQEQTEKTDHDQYFNDH